MRVTRVWLLPFMAFFTAWPTMGLAQANNSSETWPTWARFIILSLLVVIGLLAILVWLLWNRSFIRAASGPGIRPLFATSTLNTAQPTDAPADSRSTAHCSNGETFGYTISHDLRAPIRVVEGFAKILKEDYGRQLDRMGNDHLDRILGAATRMNKMIDALLALSQLSDQPLGIQKVDLSQLGEYVAEDLRRLDPDREVVFHIEPGLTVFGDPTLLRVVLENLLGNAWKYTSKRQHAEIALVRDPTDPKSFIVYDNGVGFDMRFADRLFGLFQRLHSNTDFSGTGVGLASVRRIIKKHGGEIWAEAEVDRGARFHFSLGIQGHTPPSESLRSH